ncbi:MAG: hypothetical protein GY742_11665 [Hyphomicrobiales bacterium]|nr:hypothetical protein [Hyphomicrobiales bacterium]
MFDSEEKTGHIIDPRNGDVLRIWPFISVVHRSAAIVDGLPTAFAVVSRKQVANTIRQFDGVKLIAIDSDDRCYTYG